MGPEDAPIENAGKAVAALSNLIAAAGDAPEAKQAARNLGKAAVTLTSTVNSLLLPLAAVNFAIDKARTYFNERFEAELKEASENIPEKDLKEPKAYLAAPVLQGLAFAHEEDELRRLYLALLASAMDGRAESVCHPAFADILKQITPAESKALQSLLSTSFPIAIASVTRQYPDGGRTTLFPHVLSYMRGDEQVENSDGPALVINIVRLGLFDLTYDRQLTGENAYAWVKERPEYLEALKVNLGEGESIAVEEGVLVRTPFGQQFAKAVGIEPLLV